MNRLDSFVLLVLIAIMAQTLIAYLGDRGQRIALRYIELANRMTKASTDSQLRQIHTLVNSDMTAARQGELNQTLVTIIVMKRLRALEAATGQSTVEDDQIIANTEMRAEELRGVLADRRVQQIADERNQIEEMRERRTAPQEQPGDSAV